MIVLPAGAFVQGSFATEKNREANEGPRHLVTIDYTLAVGRYEVTKAEFARFADETGHEGTGCSTYDGSWRLEDNRNWQAPGFDQDDSHPVTCISWNDAQAYVRWLGDKTGKHYRLLSASEWEYAARAGTATTAWPRRTRLRTCESANVADRSTDAIYPGWDTFRLP